MLELEDNIESDENWSDIPDTDDHKNESEDEFEQNDDNEKDKVIIEIDIDCFEMTWFFSQLIDLFSLFPFWLF